MSHNTSDSAFDRSILSICERIDSPSSKRLYDALTAQRPEAKYMPSLMTTNAKDFANDYFISKLLSKWKGWKGGESKRRANALIGWEADEAQNRITNERLLNFQRGSGFPGSDLVVIISIAQRRISDLLGRFRLRKVLSSCRWGPGATWDYPRGTYRDTKLSREMSCTREAQPFMKILIEADPNWLEAITGFYPEGPVSLVKEFWKFTENSRFTTVPKEWDIDRGIDMQPTANGYLQQGAGRYFRSRLLSVGIDLDSQEHNQDAAFRAVFDGLATLDLKAASDSVTQQLVSLLLPWDWCQYLFALRTKYTQFGHRGPVVKTEKFSAMGNAFTFELETLIFWALSCACSEFVGVDDRAVLVYGDDIIVDASVYDCLVYTLNYCGFRVNESKSFRSGPFFESCGRHYYNGDDVTPIYQKNLVNSPGECIRFHNRLVRWGERIHGDPWYFDEALLWMQAFYYDVSHNRYLQIRDLPRISLTTEGDDGFISPEELITRDVHGGYYTTVWRERRGKFGKLNHAAYLQLKLNDPSHQNGSPKGHVEESSGRGRFKLTKAYFFR